MGQSVGILEVVGMTTAIVCADQMIKFAYVEVFDVYETGSGLVTVMIQGDLASVQVAIELGVETAMKYNSLKGYKVIARPHKKLENLFLNDKVGEYDAKI